MRVKPTDRSGRWFKARVEHQVDVRSYEVRTEEGKTFRRNRRNLKNRKEPACVRVNPEPIHVPSQTHLPESLPIPKPSGVSPLKTSAPMEVPPPKEPGEMVGSKKPESSSETGKMPEQSSPPKQVDRPVTRSCRKSRPPSYLKVCLLQFYKGSRGVYHKCANLINFLHQYSDNK